MEDSSTSIKQSLAKLSKTQKAESREQLLWDQPLQEELEAWKTHRATRFLRATLENEIDELQQNWILGTYSSSSTDETAQLNADAMGTVKGLLLAIDFLTPEEADE